MADRRREDPPSPFVVHWANLALEMRGIRNAAMAPPRQLRALDVAMGRGRHAEMLAAAGYRVFGVDWQFAAVHDAVARCAAHGLSVSAWVADLTRSPLPSGAFDLVVVCRYLQRDLFSSLCESLAPGGVLIYETFTEGQRDLGWGPTSPEHLLRPLELRDAFSDLSDLDVLFYEEIARPESMARLAARRRAARSS